MNIYAPWLVPQIKIEMQRVIQIKLHKVSIKVSLWDVVGTLSCKDVL
ncbi:hypothetical protein OC699_02510 [Candidatus Phytoplasma australasiaticum]|nr:hypothetical protein [Candidatus Phytoplasma australasiaticum]MDO8031777.1 hypothetical protein [Candidatus Phytoplasma australasiaticum]